MPTVVEVVAVVFVPLLWLVQLVLDIDGTHGFVLPWRRSTMMMMMMMMMGGRSLLLLLVHFGIVIEHSFSSSSSTAAAGVVLVVGRRRRRCHVHGWDDHGRDGQFLARALVILILEVMVKQPLGAEAGPGCRHPSTRSMVVAAASFDLYDRSLICTVCGTVQVPGGIYGVLAILLSFIPYMLIVDSQESYCVVWFEQNVSRALAQRKQRGLVSLSRGQIYRD
jgi:hypothetical protein